MTDAEQREAARQFANKWKGRGREDEDGRSYWIDFLSNVLGMENVTDRVEFEKKVVVDGNTKRIDVYIPETHVLIEQKSLGKALDHKIMNSGSIELTPYDQAKRYNDNLPYDEKARWIITSNFSDIWIYDMNARVPEAVKISLDEIPSKYPLLDILIKKDVQKISHEMEVSIKAGDIVGLLYEAFLTQYKIPEVKAKEETIEQKEKREHKLKSLNALCVRIVFCLYAEDAGIFGKRNIFHDYLKAYEVKDCRRALLELFKVLDTPVSERDEYLEEDLAQFPYVNGGLFSDETIEIPPLTEEIKELLLTKASEDFDWSDISPTIFGAVFESTLNPETRRSGGMHYTSISNIHKVIDPLFLDKLQTEFHEILKIQVQRTKVKRLDEFQNKLALLTFLDPACGSGNFLTETYLSLRRLENEVIREKVGGQMTLGDVHNPIRVSIQQFYGIEINDFAVTVAKTALWIAESQMMEETKNIVYGFNDDFLPLKTYVNIAEGNALKIDWNSVVLAKSLSYIMGNPPFVGARWMGEKQKEDVADIFAGWKSVGNLDYVSCWYKKASDYMKENINIRAALVSTNSITQGESGSILWKPLFEDGIQIDYAYRTFIWDSEASIKAHVHCVIIGFSRKNGAEYQKKIYSKDDIIVAKNINGYLLDADNISIEKRMKPLSDVPPISLGGQAIDGGYLILTEEEKEELISKEPQAISFIRHYMMGKDFIDRKPRYCIWLVGADSSLLKRCPLVRERIDKVREFRMASTRNNTRKAADTPGLFASILEYDSPYIAIPKVSSQNRRYIPMDYLDGEIIPGDKLFTMPSATSYEFGILMSNVHMAWTRVVCGRLKSDYSYSNTIVYNNFPWPSPTDEQKEKIKKTAQAILNARALYPNSSLADLYDPLTMPPELLKAHNANNRAVMEAYGFSTKMSEADCVAELMKMYQKLTEEK